MDGRLVQDFVGGGMVAPDGPTLGGAVHPIDLPVWSRWHEPIGGFEPGWPLAGSVPLGFDANAAVALFDQATIVSHPDTGGQVLPNAVAQFWQSLPLGGAEIGLPTSSGEGAANGGQVFGFTGGSVHHAPDGTVSLVDAPVAADPGAAAQRFLLPGDAARGLRSATVDNRVEAFIGGKCALPRMAADINAAGGPTTSST